MSSQEEEKKNEPKDYRDESFRRTIIQKTVEPTAEGLKGRSEIRALTEEFVGRKKKKKNWFCHSRCQDVDIKDPGADIPSALKIANAPDKLGHKRAQVPVAHPPGGGGGGGVRPKSQGSLLSHGMCCSARFAIIVCISPQHRQISE